MPLPINDVINYLGNLLFFSKYVIAFLGTIIEGPIVTFMSGFLLKMGYFDFVPLYLCLFGGDFVADIGWYSVGRFGARKVLNKYGRFLKLTPETIEKIENKFKDNQQKIIFTSKITMGLSLPTLIVAGMMHVPFKKYIKVVFLGGLLWTGILLGIGYFFAHIYVNIDFLH